MMCTQLSICQTSLVAAATVMCRPPSTHQTTLQTEPAVFRGRPLCITPWNVCADKSPFFPIFKLPEKSHALTDI